MDRMEESLNQIVYSIYPPRPIGGQQVGGGPSGVMGKHPLGIVAISEIHRSQFKNRKVVRDMIEYALSEII